MVADAHKLLDERDVIWPSRVPDKVQPRMFRGLMPFPIITFETSADQVLPGILSPVYFWNDMIYSHLHFLFSAILAPAAIALNNILTGQHDPLCRDPDIKIELDHGWYRDLSCLRAQNESVGRFNYLGFSKIEHDHGTPYTANGNWLEILIQNEHLTVEHTHSCTKIYYSGNKCQPISV